MIKGEDSNKKAIDDAILEYIGILGYSKAGPEIIKNTKNALILAVNRESLDNIRAAFLMSGKKIEVIKISGSVKKLKQ